MSVKPGTQPNDVDRIRGKGMADPNGRRGVGDLIVEFQIEVPRKVDSDQEQLLRQLAELEDANVQPERKSFFNQVKEFFSADDSEE